MRNYIWAALLLAAGSCHMISPERDGATLPPRPADLRPASMGNDTPASSWRANLMTRLDSVASLAHDAVWSDGLSQASKEMDSLVAVWDSIEPRLRQRIAVYEAADSVSSEGLAAVESQIGQYKALFGDRVLAEEVRRMDAAVAQGGSFRYRGAPYSGKMIDTRKEDIHLHWKNASGEKYQSIQRLKQDLERKGETVLMITNAGMYNPDNSPQGLFIERSKVLVPLDTTSGPGGQTLNFYLKPNGVFYINNDGPHIVTTEKFPRSTKGIRFATQSGPMLVIDGQVHPKFRRGSTNTNIRNGVGLMADGRVVILISDRPVNFYDFATVFRDGLGCTQALYLDGAISQMYLPLSHRQDLGGDFGPILAVTER